MSLNVAPATVILRESFDTNPLTAESHFDGQWATTGFRNDHLVFNYSSSISDPPNGMDVTIPEVKNSPAWRKIELHFMGLGSEMSNSLIISYALGEGTGLCFPYLPYGPKSNTHRGTRNGYILRFLRHGDGSNDVEIYRSDGGWTQKLGRADLPANPISTMRTLRIWQSRQGEHRVIAEFDTADRGRARLEREFRFKDATYPPGNSARHLQLIVKAHTGTGLFSLQFHTDTWLITDHADPPDAPATSIPMADFEANLPPTVRRPVDADEWDDWGRTAQSEGRLTDAHIAFSIALDLRKKTYAPAASHPKIAASLQRMATLYALKDTSESERLYNQALRMTVQTKGTTHPDVADILFEMAGFHLRQENFETAETFFKATLATLEKSGAASDSAMLRGLQGMARFYMVISNPAEAESTYTRILTIQDNSPKTDQAELLTTVLELGRLKSDAGDLRMADKYLGRALTLMKALLGPVHPDVAGVLEDLATLRERQTRPKDYEKFLGEALSIRKTTQGITHPKTETTLMFLVEHLKRTRQIDRAESILRDHLDEIRIKLGPADPEMAKAYINIGLFYASVKRYSDALPLYQKALSIQEERRDPSPVDVAATCNGLAVIHAALGNPLEAELMYNKSILILERHSIPQPTRLLLYLSNLSELYLTQKRYPDAETVYIKIRRIRQQHHLVDPKDMADLADKMAIVCDRMNRHLERDYYRDQARQLKNTGRVDGTGRHNRPVPPLTEPAVRD